MPCRVRRDLAAKLQECPCHVRERHDAASARGYIGSCQFEESALEHPDEMLQCVDSQGHPVPGAEISKRCSPGSDCTCTPNTHELEKLWKQRPSKNRFCCNYCHMIEHHDQLRCSQRPDQLSCLNVNARSPLECGVCVHAIIDEDDSSSTRGESALEHSIHENHAHLSKIVKKQARMQQELQPSMNFVNEKIRQLSARACKVQPDLCLAHNSSTDAIFSTLCSKRSVRMLENMRFVGKNLSRELHSLCRERSHYDHKLSTLQKHINRIKKDHEQAQQCLVNCYVDCASSRDHESCYAKKYKCTTPELEQTCAKHIGHACQWQGCQTFSNQPGSLWEHGEKCEWVDDDDDDVASFPAHELGFHHPLKTPAPGHFHSGPVPVPEGDSPPLQADRLPAAPQDPSSRSAAQPEWLASPAPRTPAPAANLLDSPRDYDQIPVQAQVPHALLDAHAAEDVCTVG